jgi:hypothetical protein
VCDFSGSTGRALFASCRVLDGRGSAPGRVIGRLRIPLHPSAIARRFQGPPVVRPHLQPPRAEPDQLRMSRQPARQR